MTSSTLQMQTAKSWDCFFLRILVESPIFPRQSQVYVRHTARASGGGLDDVTCMSESGRGAPVPIPFRCWAEQGA